MLKSFIHYYKPHWKLFVFDMVCALVAASCDLMYPVISRNIINTYIPDKNLRLILTWCVALLVIYLVQAIMQYFMQYQGHVVGVRMQADMRRDVFEHLQKLPFSYFDEHKTGVIMSRIVNDLMDISEFAHHGPEDLFISLVSVIGSFIILCTINIPLTLITFAVLPFLILFVVKKRTAMTIAFRKTALRLQRSTPAWKTASPASASPAPSPASARRRKSLLKTTSATSPCGSAPTASWRSFSPVPTF